VLVTITPICLFIPAPSIVVINTQAVIIVSVCGEEEKENGAPRVEK
jgi:hypothetical protein